MKLYENIERQAIILLRGKLNHPNVSTTTGQRERTSVYEMVFEPVIPITELTVDAKAGGSALYNRY
jgi:hypothetical protein